MKTSAAHWWQRPEAFLYAWDFGRDCGRFFSLERSVLSASAFLDHRISTDRTPLSDIPIGNLLLEPVPGSLQDPGLIFHTAFCCSTLFARSLDVPGRSLVLREPSPLLQLADMRRGLTASQRNADTMLSLTLDLLARPFLPDERVILKPTNLANNIAEKILRLRPQAKAIILYDELEPFLLSVLKRPQESENGIPQFLARLVIDIPQAQEAFQNPAELPLPEQAALAWTLQIRTLGEWLANETSQRVRILGASELLAYPTKALMAANRWLGIDQDEIAVEAIAAGPLWARHAKDLRLAYNPARRSDEQRLARKLLSTPVRQGTTFAQKHLGIHRVAFPSEFHLLD